MAALQRQVVIATEDGIAVIDKQLIVDPESGVILEVENAKMAVDTGDGIVVREQQRIKGVRVPPAAVGGSGGGHDYNQRAIGSGNRDSTSNRTPIARDSSDGPPAYSALFPGIKDVRSQVGRARQQNEGKSENVAVPLTLCDIICKSFIPCCFYLILFGFNIAMIIIGSVFINDCSLNKFIPIFLIVFGCFNGLQTCCGMSKMICCRESDDESDNNKFCRKINFCSQGLVVIFLFAWFIAGNVFVFGSWGTWVDNNRCSDGGDNCCNPVLMYFSLITIIIMYAISALACCCCLCCMCCLVMMAGASSDEY